MKKLFGTLFWLGVIFISLQTHLYATNQLIARVSGNSKQAPAYIQNAVLVSEPHGAYVENSLYVEYTDYNAFPGASNVEIIHRFELPEGSVVNDLWLWIGDNIMQAIMMERRSGQHIYDSLSVTKIDPAFLKKDGDQYELHVYPLSSGHTRKVKINFITPAKFSGLTASCEMPLAFLKSSAGTTPVNFMFRLRDKIWGTPSVVEMPSTPFKPFKQIISWYGETFGFDYQLAQLSDITQLSTFNLSFSLNSADGTYFRNSILSTGNNHFEFGIVPWRIFDLKTASSISHNVLAAIDLSGILNKNYEILIPKLKTALKTSMNPGDKFNIIIAGAGQVKQLSQKWISYSDISVDSLFDSFIASTYGDSVAKFRKPVITYCDNVASEFWSFPDISNYAVPKTYSSLSNAVPYFTSSDVVASYNQGFESTISQSALDSAISSLDTLFAKGGRFICYFDKFCVGKERIATHYIPSLNYSGYNNDEVTLYRNPKGNIGIDLPDSFTHRYGYYLSTSDTAVKAELIDADGNQYILSKKIGKGLIIVTGLWQLSDNTAMSTKINAPMLGLYAQNKNYQLTNMLNSVAHLQNSDICNTVLVFSNCDSLVTISDISDWLRHYTQSFLKSMPKFNTANLLDGSSVTPPYTTIDGVQYYGSGYLLQKIADTTGGGHIETHSQDWASVYNLMKSGQNPTIDSIKFTPSLSENGTELKYFGQVGQIPTSPDSPLFYIGLTNSTKEISFSVDIRYKGSSEVKHASFKCPFPIDTADILKAITSMVGNALLNQMLQSPLIDTSKIIQHAIKYNLLCDYTSLLALEPNDTIHYMVNPLDESSFFSTDVTDNIVKTDSLGLSIYPNPFNPSTRVSVSLLNPSSLKITVYDILGREVMHLLNEENVSGKLHVTWNGTDDYGRKIASGIYLISMRGKEVQSGKTFTIIKKAIMLK